ncbi:MAG TPA: NADH-quinone oxidoreductase subunit N [Anaerolineae bacterium]|nr:NADH-quinone oxidoreductase subunit N [Anaerolineae bacterium]
MITPPTFTDFYTLLPYLILTVWACVLLLVDLFIPKNRKSITAILASVGIAVSIGYTVTQIGITGTGFNNMVALDGFSTFANILLLVSGLFGIALAYGYAKRMNIERGEYYTLLLFSLTGMMLMAQATDLIIVFLALELLSIPLYVLSAISRRIEAEESGVKYFLLGAFASGFVVYGIALIYGATGSTALNDIFFAASSGDFSLLLSIGAALLLVGFGFKVAAVPFHMWTPDVYQGAPTPVTAFMSSGAKIAGFVALFRVFTISFPTLASDLTNVLWVLSALTMIVGNFVALSQSNIKRLLAYSAIAQAGYILMAFVPYGIKEVAPVAVASGLFYLVAYTVSNFGTWAVVIALEKAENKGLELDDYAGLAKKYPALAIAMTIFMLSLIGFPPTLGMVGKFYLFRAVMDGGFVGLAIIGVLTSVVSAYYYLRVVVNMYMKEGDPTVENETWLNFTTAITAIVTVVVSLVPNILFLLASTAVF